MSLTPRSAIARSSAISATRSVPSRWSPRRRSSTRMSSVSSTPISSQRLSAKSALNRSSARPAAFSNCLVCGCNSANLESAASRSVSSKISKRLIRSPSTVRTLIPRHSASKPPCKVSCVTEVTTAPRSLNRCTASMALLKSGVAFQFASNADTSPGANDIPRRWSMFNQSGVVAGCSRRLSAA